MFLHHHFRFCQGILPVALVEIDSSQQSIGRNLVESVGVALVPGSHLQTGLCLLDVGNHLLVNLLHAAAGEHVVDICLQRERDAAGGSRIAMGIGIGIEIDEQEVAVGSHHIGLAHQLTDFILCSLGNLVLILDDVVGDVDGMIVAAPAERSRGALLVEVVPCPDVEVRIVILGRGGCLAQGHLVASQGGESTVFREILVFVGEQGSVFLARLGYHLSGWGDVEEIIATGESYHRQHHDDAHQISSFHCLHSFRNLRLRQI